MLAWMRVGTAAAHRQPWAFLRIVQHPIDRDSQVLY
jgi:hypothetical protein